MKLIADGTSTTFLSNLFQLFIKHEKIAIKCNFRIIGNNTICSIYVYILRLAWKALQIFFFSILNFLIWLALLADTLSLETSAITCRKRLSEMSEIDFTDFTRNDRLATIFDKISCLCVVTDRLLTHLKFSSSFSIKDTKFQILSVLWSISTFKNELMIYFEKETQNFLASIHFYFKASHKVVFLQIH